MLIKLLDAHKRIQSTLILRILASLVLTLVETGTEIAAEYRKNQRTIQSMSEEEHVS